MNLRLRLNLEASWVGRASKALLRPPPPTAPTGAELLSRSPAPVQAKANLGTWIVEAPGFWPSVGVTWNVSVQSVPRVVVEMALLDMKGLHVLL